MIYHGKAGLADISDTVRKAVRDIGPHKDKFDFLCVTGMSGALVGSPVAIKLNIPLVVVRKPNDDSHSGNRLIGHANAHGKFLFLDDFISIGSTFRRVMRIMADEEFAPSRPRYAGSYLYERRILSWDGDEIVSYQDLDDDMRWSILVCEPPDETHMDIAA